MESVINLTSSSPKGVPQDLTKLPASYKLKVTLAIFAIVVFFLLYAGMITGAVFLVRLTVFEIHPDNVPVKIGAMFGSLMLLAFTVKFLFKLRNNKAKNRLRLNQQDYPELWAFIESICQETGAPKPVAIYADPDVNAYVSYRNMWLSLILPVRKELTIGLGLVDCLNMLEFKAVMAHEFGHFSQRSMKIGSYIISANTIIYDMIYSRDRWDRWLDRWRRLDIRLSFVAWIITGLIWCVRQVLVLFYQFLHLMHSLVSREMEFNADKVAVSTAGSMAMVSSLWKLDPGTVYWQTTLHHVSLAADKQQYVKNSYYHNQLSIERGKAVLSTKEAALPVDSRGGKRYFSGSESSKVSMYASHPPDHLREANAKAVFIACEPDERSPWLLFRNKEILQEQMTELIYKQYLGVEQPVTHVNPGEFEAFIAEETRDEALLSEHHNTFKDRFLTIPSVVDLEQEMKHFFEPDERTLLQLKERLKKLMEPVWEMDKLLNEVREIASGTSTKKSFSYGNVTYSKKEMQLAYERVAGDREKLLNQEFTSWDASFCAFHWLMAQKLNRTSELGDLYALQRRIVMFYKLLLHAKNDLIGQFQRLQAMSEVEHTDINNYFNNANKYITRLSEELKVVENAQFVPLPNILNATELREAMLNGAKLEPLNQPMFENGEFNRLMELMELSTRGCFRVDQKVVGAILMLHKELQEQSFATEK